MLQCEATKKSQVKSEPISILNIDGLFIRLYLTDTHTALSSRVSTLFPFHSSNCHSCCCLLNLNKQSRCDCWMPEFLTSGSRSMGIKQACRGMSIEPIHKC